MPAGAVRDDASEARGALPMLALRPLFCTGARWQGPLHRLLDHLRPQICVRRFLSGRAIELPIGNKDRFLSLAVAKILAIKVWGRPTEGIRAFDRLFVDRVTGFGK